MIEPVMYLAIGFLVSMLFGLMVLPLVHNRAVRLTTRRLEAATPLSMAEIQADKDQLRAEFAMSARRLEMSVEQLKNKTTSQLAELGKKSDAINRMKIELGEKNATIFSLESRESSVREQLRVTEDEFASKTEALRTAEAALSDKRAELARITDELNDRSIAADTRQVELVAVQTQIEALKNRVGDAEGEFATTQQRLETHRAESEVASRDLAQARGQVDSLTQRVADLDGQLAAQTGEAQSLGQRIKDMQDNLALQNRLLAQRDEDNARLQQAHDAAVLVANAAREELAAGGSGKSAALDKVRAEKAAVEEQLRLANEERARLQGELGAIQQQAESSWATERMENALLRERINDIAAEVAKLAITLEGPNSVIESMLAADPVLADKPARAAESTPNAPQVEGTLADRIRALQSHASRARLAGADNA